MSIVPVVVAFTAATTCLVHEKKHAMRDVYAKTYAEVVYMRQYASTVRFLSVSLPNQNVVDMNAIPQLIPHIQSLGSSRPYVLSGSRKTRRATRPRALR